MSRWRAALTATVLMVSLLPAAAAAAGCDASVSAPRPGLAALHALPDSAPLLAVVTHDQRPDQTSLQRLSALGLRAQPLRKLPMTIVFGTVGQLHDAAAIDGVKDVYPNRPLQLLSRKSTGAIGADSVWSGLGYTGRGVGIAVVDSGIDGTHPAFAERVRRNVKIVGPEYLSTFGVPTEAVPAGSLVVPVDQGPYSNTDTFGHGTHVAGIAAAGDVGASADDSPVGVAPEADLYGYAVGEAVVVTVLAAFDDILATHDEHGIRIVNNSWGDRYSMFDENAPLNVATKALHDAGLVVTFAAGNETEEMTLNSAAAAPWVVSVASANLSGSPSPSSSAGLAYDNSTAAAHDGHAHFDGDGLGLYHPAVAAPGENITSTATITGPAFGSSRAVAESTTTSSGTSMAAPHVAGLAALLLEANQALTPDQVKQALQVTASPAPGWSVPKTGFGFIDATRAVSLVSADGFDGSSLVVAQGQREAALLARRDATVAASDHWSFSQSTPVTAGGVEHHCFPFEVSQGDVAVGVSRVRAGLNFAGTADGVRNEFRWSLEIRDAAGTVVGSGQALRRNGITTADIDLTDRQVAFGTWTANVTGEIAVSGVRPLLTPHVTVVVTQLIDKPPSVEPSDARVWALAALGQTATPATSPEGCVLQTPPAGGVLADGAPGGAAPGDCAAALIGVDAKDAAGKVTFAAPPLTEPLTLTGRGELVAHLADEVAGARGAAVSSRLSFTVDAIDPSTPAAPIAIGSGQPSAQLGGETRGSYGFDTATVTLPAGAVVRVALFVTGAGTNVTRLLYGGAYDSALTLTAG